MFANLKALRKVSELEDRFERLNRAFKELELEWQSTHDKLLQLYQRIAKRHEAAVKAQEAQESQVEGVDGPTESSPLSHLTPKQRLIQHQIEQRRRANGGIR